MIIFKDFDFDSAHFLPNVSDDHKCKQIHGHTYRMKVFFSDALDNHYGWVMDFAEIKKVVNPIINSIDHKLLNDIEGLENPTCEAISIWLWDKIKAEIPILCRIELYVTLTSGVVYEGE